MRVISRVHTNVLNSQRMATMKDLEKLFAVAPNMAAKTIRLFPQNSISMFTEGLGEIYDISAKSDNFIGLNNNQYKWKIRGHEVAKPVFVTRSTGGAISTNSTVGGNGVPFTVAFNMSYYNPRDIIKLEDGSLLYVLSEATYIGQNVFEYSVRINTDSSTETIDTDYLQPGRESGLNGNAYPELSDRGYISAAMAHEEHINYLTKVRYDWSFSADAAATKYVIEDQVFHNGQMKKMNLITDQLLYQAMERYHLNKELALIYGKRTVDANGRCFLQDEKGQDIIEGDGLIAQMHSSRKQTYTNLSISLLEDVLADLSYHMPNPTGNVILVTTGIEGYKEFGRLMRAEHKGFWSTAADKYVQTKNGKIQLGAHYNAFEFQGNKIIVNVNRVFDHPANVSEKSATTGKKLESSKFLFIDASSYDGTPNLQLIAKDGRSFITGELDGIGGQSGKASGKVSSLLDGSARSVIGTLGIVMHNPYSSMMLEKKIV
jgi:hypothetical protein